MWTLIEFPMWQYMMSPMWRCPLYGRSWSHRSLLHPQWDMPITMLKAISYMEVISTGPIIIHRASLQWQYDVILLYFWVQCHSHRSFSNEQSTVTLPEQNITCHAGGKYTIHKLITSTHSAHIQYILCMAGDPIIIALI